MSIYSFINLEITGVVGAYGRGVQTRIANGSLRAPKDGGSRMRVGSLAPRPSGAAPGRTWESGAQGERRLASGHRVSVPDPLDFAFEQEARLVSLEAGQLAASIICAVAILVAIASGATSLLLGRAIDRHRNREIAYALLDMRDWLAR